MIRIFLDIISRLYITMVLTMLDPTRIKCETCNKFFMRFRMARHLPGKLHKVTQFVKKTPDGSLNSQQSKSIRKVSVRAVDRSREGGSVLFLLQFHRLPPLSL